MSGSMRRKTIRRGCYAVVVALLFVGPLLAQFDRGQVSGFVKDPGGLFVPGATATFVNEASGVSRSTVTNDGGYFILMNLDVGYYKASVELTGFKTYQQEHIKLDANARIALNVTLEVGALNEVVTVESSTVELQRTTAQLGRIVDIGLLENMAMYQRNPLNLVRLKAGIVGGSTSSASSRTDGGFSINGSRGDENLIFIDGTISTRTRSAGFIIGTMNADTVQEMQVLASNYNAEYGRSSGGQVRFISKSGSRNFHGGVFENFRNSVLNANSWARNRSTDSETSRRPSPFRFNQFGFDLSGPMYIPGHFNAKKEKLFLMWAEEWVYERSTGLATLTVPSLKMRQGDFSELLVATNPFFNAVKVIRDPLTGQPFPGNIIPASRLSKNGMALINSFDVPTPNFVSTGSTNQAETNPSWTNTRKDTARIDYYPNIKHQISWRGSFHSLESENLTEKGYWPNRNMALSWTWSVRSNLINEATYSAAIDYNWIDLSPQILERSKRSKFGIDYPYLFPGTKVRDDKIPTIDISNFSGNYGARLPLFSAGPIFTWSDNMTWVKGTHTFKWGVFIERSGENDFDQINVSQFPGDTNNQNGRFEFRDNRANGTGLAIANAALGLFSNYAEIGNRSYTPWKANAVDLYAQDSWKMRPNFTVEYGVRYVRWPPWRSLWGNFAMFDARYYDRSQMAVVDRTGGFIVSGDPYNGVILPGSGWPDAAKGRVAASSDPSFNRLFHGLPEGIAPTHNLVFEPRLGAAWSVNPITVVRFGVGMFHQRTVLNDSVLPGGNPPIQLKSGVSEGSADNPGSSAGIKRTFPLLVTAWDLDNKAPVSWAWNLTLQRRLPWDITVESAYVSRRSYRQMRMRNLNQLLTGTVQANPGVNTDALRPYQGLGAIRVTENAGQSWYHGWQTEVNRRFTHGLAFGMAYTFSKVTSDTEGKGTLLPNSYNTAPYYAISGLNRTSVFRLHYIYELPFLKKQDSLLSKAFGGWRISGITEWSSGSPLSPGWRSEDIAGVGTGSGSQPYNITGDPHVAQTAFSYLTTDSNYWFDPKVFVRPTSGTFGNVGRNILENPSGHNHDLGLSKTWMIREQTRVELRAEMFNWPNHPNWGGASTDPTSSTFARVTSKAGQRDVEFGLKIRF